MSYKYSKDFPARLKTSMSMGYSFESSCASLGVCRKTGYLWVEKFPEFAKAKLEGEAMALRFLESYALSALTGTVPESAQKKGARRIDTTMAIFFLKTRFHRIYGDKMKIENNPFGKEPFKVEMNYKKPGNKKDK